MRPKIRGILPEQEKVRAAYAMYHDGRAYGAIQRETGLAWSTLLRVLGQPGDESSHDEAVRLYDPYNDEVAIARALRGERRVWEALTYYEEVAVYERMTTRTDRDKAERASRPGALDGKKRLSLVSSAEEDGWLRQWCDSVGANKTVANQRMARIRRRRQAGCDAVRAA